MKAYNSLLAAVWILISPTQETKAQWVQTNGPHEGHVNCFAVSGPNLFAGTYSDGVFLSTDNGTSWSAVNTGFPPYTSVYSLAVSGMNLFAGTDGAVFLSTNNGTGWTQVNSGLSSYYVYSFAVSGTNLFAGTNGGGVFLSTNKGTSWTAVNTGLPTNTTVYALAVSPASGGTGGTNLFAGTYGGVFLSTNNGTSWTAVNTGLPLYISVYSFAVSGTNLFAGTNGGVFLSTNNGTSWTAVNTGLTYTSVYSFAVSGTDLFAGTGGGGVWRRALFEMITSVREIAGNGLPERYTLEQNYPNPFNPSTTIRFSLPKSGYVTLKVYDVLGREIETLVDGDRTAGTYSVEWTPNNLASGVSSKGGYASGVYFYRIQAGPFSDVKKLLLLK